MQTQNPAVIDNLSQSTQNNSKQHKITLTGILPTKRKLKRNFIESIIKLQ